MSAVKSTTPTKSSATVVLVKTIKAPTPSGRTSSGYVAHLAKADVVDTADVISLAEKIAAGSLSRAVITAGLNQLPTVLAEVCRAYGGASLRLGELGTLQCFCQGPFPAADADFDPTRNALVLRLQLGSVLRNALATSQVRNVTSSVSSAIAQVYDTASGTPDTIIGKGSFTISGRNLMIVSGRDDEKVELVSADGATVVGTATLTTDTLGVLVGVFEVAAPLGTFILRVSTRGGLAADTPLVMLTHAVTVIV